jgi:hypothetical protein
MAVTCWAVETPTRKMKSMRSWATQAIACILVPTMSSRDVIAALVADGWFLDRVKGSHHQFRHPTKPGIVTVPHP